MKEKYYSIERSSDYLAHYGIKGMKWGVQKAKEKPMFGGSNKKLDKQYNKAAKKLAKLERNADIDAQAKDVKKYKTIAAIGGAAGTLGAAGAGIKYGQVKNLVNKRNSVIDDVYKNGKHLIYNGKPVKDYYYNGSIYVNRKAVVDMVSEPFNKEIGSQHLKGIGSAALGLAGAGTAIGAGIKAHKAKYRTTYTGHKEAVAKRDAWKKEMKAAFKGTHYANLPPYAKKSAKHSDLEDHNSLAHYGIKGMKWGVQKAIERGNEKALTRQYNKAAKKLAKLERNADMNYQSQIVSKEKKAQTRSRRIGEAGLALGAGHAAGSIYSGARKAIDMAKKTGTGIATVNLNPAIAAGAIGIGSLIDKSIHKHRKNQAIRRMSSEGHAKAVAKRDAWKKEMNEAFKGTQYASKKRSKAR